MKRRALTLIEVMITLVLCAVVFGPLYVVFSSSRKNVLHAQGTSIATSHASSMIAALKQIKYDDLCTMGAVSDVNLKEPFTLKLLGISSMPKSYSRTLSIDLMDTSGDEGGPYFLATVEIRWKPRTIKKFLKYRIMGFLNNKDTIPGGEE